MVYNATCALTFGVEGIGLQLFKPNQVGKMGVPSSKIHVLGVKNLLSLASLILDKPFIRSLLSVNAL